MQAEIILEENDRICVSGPLTFDTVAPLRVQGEQLMQRLADGQVVFDLEGVTDAGSAGLSLLFCWLRRGNNLGLTVQFTNLPSGLLGVAGVSGVDQLLPIG